MELESTTAASKTILDLLDENLAKECKTFQSKFNMLTQQIHSHQQKNSCLGAHPSTQAKNLMCTSTKHTMGTGTPKPNHNTRNNHHTKKTQTNTQTPTKTSPQKAHFLPMIKTTIAYQLIASLSTKQNMALQPLVPTTLLPLTTPPAVDTVAPPRAQTKGNPITTSHEMSNT